jgi:hypothetical protein
MRPRHWFIFAPKAQVDGAIGMLRDTWKQVHVDRRLVYSRGTCSKILVCVSFERNLIDRRPRSWLLGELIAIFCTAKATSIHHDFGKFSLLGSPTWLVRGM